MATILKRGKQGTWWIKYYANGRQVYHSLRTTNRRVAESARKQIEAEADRGDLVAPSRTPLPEFLEQFIGFLRTIRSFKAMHNDLSVLRIVFGPVCPGLEPRGRRTIDAASRPRRKQKAPRGKKRGPTVPPLQIKILEEVTTGMIEQYLIRRIQADGIAPKTVNRTREVLHRMFNYARKQHGYVNPNRRSPNPIADVERRPEPARSIRFLNSSQIDNQLAVLEVHPTVYAMVAVMIYAGLRREEVTWLTTRDVDLSKRLIQVRAKTVDGAFWQPKTKRNRVVPISSALLAVLGAYTPPRQQPWYFTSPKGCRYDPDNFSHRLAILNAKAQLPWGSLDYRHTFGSHLAQKGESLYKIATLMGNSPDICRKHYACLVPETMHDVVEFSPPDSQPPAVLNQQQPACHSPHTQPGRATDYKDQVATDDTPRLRLVR